MFYRYIFRYICKVLPWLLWPQLFNGFNIFWGKASHNSWSALSHKSISNYIGYKVAHLWTAWQHTRGKKRTSITHCRPQIYFRILTHHYWRIMHETIKLPQFFFSWRETKRYSYGWWYIALWPGHWSEDQNHKKTIRIRQINIIFNAINSFCVDHKLLLTWNPQKNQLWYK